MNGIKNSGFFHGAEGQLACNGKLHFWNVEERRRLRLLAMTVLRRVVCTIIILIGTKLEKIDSGRSHPLGRPNKLRNIYRAPFLCYLVAWQVCVLADLAHS